MGRVRIRNWVLAWATVAAIGPGSAAAQITFEHTYGGTRPDWGRSVQQTQDGGYIIAGHTKSFGAGSRDVYLIKTDPWGDTLWTRTYGDANAIPEEAFSVQQTLDGGCIVTGFTDWWVGDVFLLKTDAGGDSLWMRTFGGSGADYGHSVQQTEDGGYIIAGMWTLLDVCLIKTDSSGDTLWTRTYGGSDHDYGNSVQQTSDGGYVVTGQWIFGPEGKRNSH